MERKYSVFLTNVGTCSDRYCSAYGCKISIDEMFERVNRIPLLSAVDLVLSDEVIENFDIVKKNLKKYGLKVASVAADIFGKTKYGKGSLGSVDAEIRKQAIEECKAAMDYAAELDCRIMTLWPGQDGYDYLFQADYIKERKLFSDAVAELCEYRKDIIVTLEYKQKEPRTHSYISSVGTALLMINDIGADNLGVALDYGHAALGYETPAEAVAICSLYGNRLKHIHINDNYRLWDDDMITGSVHTLEYLEFIYWLRKTGYNGYITLDQFPYRENGEAAVSESAEWLNFFENIMDNFDERKIEEVLGKQDAIAASKLMRKLLGGKNND